MKTYPPRARPSTIEQLIGSPYEGTFELVEGKLERTPMSPFTSYLATRLLSHLGRYCDQTGLGYVFEAETYYYCFASPKTSRKADGSVILKDRLPADWQQLGYFSLAPDLAFEVVSPRDRASRVKKKIQEYRQAGVRLLWVIYPEERFADVYYPGGHDEVSEHQELTGRDVLPGFHVWLSDLYPPTITPAN